MLTAVKWSAGRWCLKDSYSISALTLITDLREPDSQPFSTQANWRQHVAFIGVTVGNRTCTFNRLYTSIQQTDSTNCVRLSVTECMCIM